MSSEIYHGAADGEMPPPLVDQFFSESSCSIPIWLEMPASASTPLGDTWNISGSLGPFPPTASSSADG